MSLCPQTDAKAKDAMRAYFLAANFWLFIAGSAWVGKTPVGTPSPPREAFYKLFGVGHEYQGSNYSVLIIAPLLLSVICCLLWLITSKKCKAGK
ncbi:MAG TPA: hypothetical protein VFW73_11145 [Lacipirellulaceae bacterium]|nr:hypothetical protein [Lacipirellulaceae bacterium]